MQKGDLVFIMGNPGQPILGTHSEIVPGKAALAESIKHGTPAMVIDVDNDAAANQVHVKVLLQGMALWVPGGFVKVTNESR